MISDIEEFIKTFHGQRRRTQWIVDAIPSEKTNWRPWPGEPSPTEIIRCIAAGHLMYARAFAQDVWQVEDYENVAVSWEESLQYFQRKTEEALDLLRPLPNTALKGKRRRPGNDTLPVAAWRLLLAMLEHEIHFRATLNLYLMLMNARQPNMGGLTIEAVRAALHQAGAPSGSMDNLQLFDD